MAGIALVVHVLVMVVVMVVVMAVLMVNLTVAMDLVSMAHGHVMVRQTAMMAQMKPTVVRLLVMTVNMTGLLTDLNAVIQQQMNLVLTVQHLKVIMAGIAPVVTAH